MKKIISAFLVGAFALCFLTISVFADATVECEKVLSSDKKKLTVSAVVSENAMASTATMYLTYDNKALTIGTGEDEVPQKGDYVLSGAMFQINPKMEENKMKIVYVTLDHNPEKGKMFTVTFDVTDESLLNDDSVKLEVEEMHTVDSEPIKVTVNQTANQNGSSNQTNNNALIIILSVVGGVIIIGAIVTCVIIITKKNKKQIKK